MMAGMDRPTVANREFRIGEWTRGPHARTGPAPHYHEWADRRDPINQFGVVWKDERHEHPEAVVDIDGCRAPVLPLPVVFPYYSDSPSVHRP